MSSKQRPSTKPTLPPPRSVVALYDSRNDDLSKLMIDLQKNYLGVQQISRHAVQQQDKSVPAILIDFKSEKSAKAVLDKGYILIDGKRQTVRPYWPPKCRRCEQEGHVAADCLRKPLTEQRVMELFAQQEEQLEAMMRTFERKWEARLSSADTPSVNTSQIMPALQEFTTVCEQFNRQNVQLQQVLSSMLTRVQGVPISVTNAAAHPPLPWANR